jgi:hypothetical protein
MIGGLATRAVALTGILWLGRFGGDGGPAARVALADETRPSYHTATGTLAAYDPVARELTVSNPVESTVYRVASDARAWLGHRRLPLRELAQHVGAQVTLAWAEVDGKKTTHTVRIDEPGSR